MNEHSFVEQPGALAFDSTQTLRAISPSESRDPNQQKWFVVQLAVSDRPVNLEAMPRLDVFVAYRLYAVEGRQGSSARYCLRLGFFDEEQSAQTICGYVKTFFRSPSVVRVSAAERARFDPKNAVNRAATISAVTTADSRPAPQRSVPALERSAQPQKTASSSRQLGKKNKSLAQELLEEARQVELAKSGRHRVVKQPTSWLSRLLGGSKA